MLLGVKGIPWGVYVVHGVGLSVFNSAGNLTLINSSANFRASLPRRRSNTISKGPVAYYRPGGRGGGRGGGGFQKSVVFQN